MATKKKAVMLSKDDILGNVKLEVELVEVPEWGGSVYVRAMSGAERDAFEADSIKGKGKKKETDLTNLRARLVVRTLCDKDGKRTFTNADDGALGKMSAKPIARVFDVASRLSGISEEDIEELEGN